MKLVIIIQSTGASIKQIQILQNMFAYFSKILNPYYFGPNTMMRACRLSKENIDIKNDKKL